MNYAEIKEYDIANGTGVRTTLFVSGCLHRCPGCFNEEQWDFSAGHAFTPEVQDHLLHTLDAPYIDGISVLGGEPLEPRNQEGLLPFLQRVRASHPDKDVWMWTGFVWEDLSSPGCRACTGILPDLLACVDVLVDGPFVLDRRDITLRFRGSPNQRIIDVPASLEAGRPVPWSDGGLYSTRRWQE